MNKYSEMGVSSGKEELHAALLEIDEGIFPTAFCKIQPDFLGGSSNHCNIVHSDGVGTKSSLAYMMYQETKDSSVFKNIMHDALVMNIDDLLCIGAIGNFLVSNCIGRNKHLISGEILKELIHGIHSVALDFKTLDIPLMMMGGETADIGDIVKSLIVDVSIATRMLRDNVIKNDKIKSGDVIIGLASSGQTTYESVYNSGIGSNGLTAARHELLSGYYTDKYPETYDNNLSATLVYSGNYQLESKLKGTPLTIGQALLSPTRTYYPIIKELLENHRNQISGLIHCTGGGQTKCLYYGKQIHYIKNNLFEIPPIFKCLMDTKNQPIEDMYSVYNMGHRFEIIGEPSLVPIVSEISDYFNCNSQQIGVCKSASKNKVTIKHPTKTFTIE